MKKLSLFVFYSGGASGLRYLKDNDPNYGNTYEVVGTFTDNTKAFGKRAFSTGNDSTIDYSEWCEQSGCSKKDMVKREEYFAEIMAILKPMNIDLILLSGFMLKVPSNFIGEYENRIINVHPADLSVVTLEGKPLYTGAHAVKMAMDHGNNYTRSTVHFVTNEVDCGKKIMISNPLSVEEGISPEEQQEKMKDACDGPAIMEAINQIVEGKVSIGTKK